MINFWHLTILLQLIVIAIGLFMEIFYESVDYSIMLITSTLIQFTISIGFLLVRIF